jgi:hypothetical protein
MRQNPLDKACISHRAQTVLISSILEQLGEIAISKSCNFNEPKPYQALNYLSRPLLIQSHIW